jgi:hypothetical protein
MQSPKKKNACARDTDARNEVLHAYANRQNRHAQNERADLEHHAERENDVHYLLGCRVDPDERCIKKKKYEDTNIAVISTTLLACY